MLTIKTPEEIKLMQEGGRLLAKIIKKLEKEAKPGITTKELNRLAESLILSFGAKCSFLNYQGFPACLCTSVNEEIVHAVPSFRILKTGDIISLDLGLQYKGFHSDMAITVPVGKIDKQAEKLIKVTKKSLEIGIKQIKPGNKIGDISRAVQKYVEGQGFGVVRELCGHGIGRQLHEDPEILNAVTPDKTMVDKVPYTDAGKIEIKEGMVLCVEPMVTVGDWHIKKSKDGFGFETRDASLSCHFEHMVAVTKTGCQILTEL